MYDGSSLHGGGLGNSGNHGGGGSQFFRYQDGAFFNGLTVIAFELQDTHCNGGGFCCVSVVLCARSSAHPDPGRAAQVPGSHQGHVKLPASWRKISEVVADPEQFGGADWLYKVPAAAGDAIVFTEALTVRPSPSPDARPPSAAPSG